MPLIQEIVLASGGSNFVPQTRTLTINGVSFDLSADRTYTVEVLDDLIATAPLSYNSGTNTISISQSSGSVDGYLSSADFLTFSAKQPAITLTTTGNSGVSTLVGATLNVPEYTLAGLGGFSNPMTSLGDTIFGNAVGLALRRAGNITTTKMYLSQTGDGSVSAAPQWSAITASDVGAVPTSRTITINDVSFDLTANRIYSVGDYEVISLGTCPCTTTTTTTAAPCNDYYNNSGGDYYGIDYTDCGGTTYTNQTVGAGQSICVQGNPSGGDSGLLILLGNC